MASFYTKFMESQEEENKVPIPTTDKELPSALIEALEKSEEEALVEDASANALGLRNLFRQGKIGKDQYIAGLATLVAAGAISKSEFTGLKASAN